jgi:predicted nucleotidyltransferase component of viral defense system
VIAEKFVDLYARNSGLRDKLVAERDIVLTYALWSLIDAGMMDQLAFKGGTCLRKAIFGSTGRFSEDLDFTLDSNLADDEVLIGIVEAFNRDSHGIVFDLRDYYKTEDETSFGGDVSYRHEWNDNGRFRLQVSLRERPTLPARRMQLKPQAYFRYLEFSPFKVRSLEPIEMIAEKIRAAFQRAKVRDLYDLYSFAKVAFNGELLRRLVVIKLWQARQPFAPADFFRKLRGEHYDWGDLRSLIRASERVEPAEILSSIEDRYAVLSDLTELEQGVSEDAKSGWNEPLAERLRAQIRELAARE